MNSPSIAVVLPTCNRIGMLKRTLRSLEAQDYKDFIVYVSDDASKDETRLLGSRDFPNLNVQVARRLTSFPTLMDHFSSLFYGVKEDIVLMAHDDEVYHPSWISIMAQSFANPEIVFSFGQTVSVDAKTNEKVFYIDPAPISEGIFTARELMELVLTKEIYLPANGFGVRTSALQGVGPFLSTYEQFDYEWMMRVVPKGKTQVFPDFLASYTVHSSNTVGSRKYLDRLLHQRTANHMREEWLEALPDFDPERRAEIKAELLASQGDLEWANFLRALAYGESELSETYGQRVLSHPNATFQRKALARVALTSGGKVLSSKVLGMIFRHRAKSPMRQRHLSLLERDEAFRRFPTLALFDEPLN